MKTLAAVLVALALGVGVVLWQPPRPLCWPAAVGQECMR